MHALPRGHYPPPKHTYTPSTLLILFLIVARQRLEKVRATPLDIDSAIVVISSFPFLYSKINNSLPLSLEPSIHLPYVGWSWTYTLTHTGTHSSQSSICANVVVIPACKRACNCWTTHAYRHTQVHAHKHTSSHTPCLSKCQQPSSSR